MPRFVFYDLFSAQGILLHSQNEVLTQRELISAAKKHAKAYTSSREVSDGNRYRVQRIPEWDEVVSVDYIYRAPREPRMEALSDA